MGIGNTLLGDEGIGIHVLKTLDRDRRCGNDVDLIDGGTLGFSLSGPIGDADLLIVVDAAELDAPSGSIRIFVDDEMDRFLGGNRRRSVHEVGLIDLMAVSALSGCLPPRRALVGIQPGQVDWSDQPTAAVAAAIPHACSEIERLLSNWPSPPQPTEEP